MLEESNASKHKVPSFSGIALADILANGASILILLIIVHLSIKTEIVEQAQQQTETISSLLSREEIQSLIMNALPASPPAILHDYEKSFIDRNPNHHIMPILQLTNEGVVDFYQKELFSADSFVHKNNRLDKYIGSLSQLQKYNMRLDIYSIRHFYLLMSILRSHDIEIKHWHFLTEKPVFKPINTRTQLADVTSLQTNQAELMEGVEPRPYEDKLAHYGESNLLTADKNQQNSQLLSLPVEAQSSEANKINLSIKDFRNVISFIFDFLPSMNDKVQNGHIDYLDQIDLNQLLQDYIFRFPKISRYMSFLVEQVYAALTTQQLIWPQFHFTQTSQSATVTLPINKQINNVLIESNIKTQQQEGNQLSLLIHRYPLLSEGKRQAITNNTVIMIDPLSVQSNQAEWHSVAILNFAQNQSMIGFVYGYIDQNGQLSLLADENKIELNGQALPSHFPTDDLWAFKATMQFYLIAFILFIIILIFFRYRYAY